MKNLVIISAVLTIAAAVPFFDRNTVNKDFLLRPKRDEVAVKNTKYGLKDGIPYVNQQVNLANSNGHRLDANAIATKDFHNNGPLHVGGNLQYGHPSGSGVVIGATKTRGGGTNVEAAGVLNVYRNGGFGVDLKGGYSQHFGGPGGSRPEIYGVEIRGGYAFPRRG